jgi:tetratricopeptide (TPR) repeat protein
MRENSKTFVAFVLLITSQILSYLINNLIPIKELMLLVLPILAKNSQLDIILQIGIGILIFLLILAIIYIEKLGVSYRHTQQTPIDRLARTYDKAVESAKDAERFIEGNCPDSTNVTNISGELLSWIQSNKALLEEFPLTNPQKWQRNATRMAILQQAALLVVNLTRHIVVIITWGSYWDERKFLSRGEEWNDNYVLMAKQAFIVGSRLSSEKELKATFDLAYMIAQLFYSRSQSLHISEDRRDGYREEAKLWIKNLKRIMEKLVPDSDVLMKEANWLEKLKKTVKKWVTRSHAQNLLDPNLVSECEAKWLYMEGLKQKDFEGKQEKTLVLFQEALAKARNTHHQVHIIICETAKYLGSVKKHERNYTEAIRYYQEALDSTDCQTNNYEEMLNSASYPRLKAECYQQLGELQHSSKKHKDAKITFQMLMNYIITHNLLISFKSDAHKGMADALNEQVKENERRNLPVTLHEIEEGYNHAKDAYECADPNQQLSDTKLVKLIIYFADRLLKNQKQQTV